MTEDVTTWGDTEDDRCRAMAMGDDDSRPHIMVLGEPEEIVRDLARAFSERSWEIVVVDDLESAVDIIANVSLSAVVLPIEFAEVGVRCLLNATLDRSPIKYLPLIAYPGRANSDRARAWIARCDGFVSYSEGSAGLCREVATLLVVARIIAPLLSRAISPQAGDGDRRIAPRRAGTT